MLQRKAAFFQLNFIKQCALCTHPYLIIVLCTSEISFGLDHLAPGGACLAWSSGPLKDPPLWAVPLHAPSL